jgi:hypothetical protein
LSQGNGLSRILGTAGFCMNPGHWHLFCGHTRQKRIRQLCLGKSCRATGVLPSLGQGQAAHHMSSSYCKTGIGPNQKYAWFHRLHLFHF